MKALARHALTALLLIASFRAAAQQTQPTTRPTRGRVGQNLSYLRSWSGRVLIDAAHQGDDPQPTADGLRWSVITKGTPDAFNGTYTIKADSAVDFRITGGSPAKIVGPGLVQIAAQPGQTAQLHLLFPGRSELPPGIMVIRPGYTEAQAREEVFTREFVAMLARLNPGVIRAMDWQRTNGNETTGWDARCRVTDALWGVKGRGGPVEPVIALCNRLRADLWVCVPHGADDDYVRQLATLVRDALDAGLRVYVELSNEAWNTAAGFPQSEYFKARGDADPAIVAAWPQRDQRTQRGRFAYAKRTSQVAAIFREVFNGQPDRLVVLLAGATNDSGVLRDALAFGFRPDALATAGYFNADKSAATADAVFASFAANARALYAGTQIAKFNALADAGPYRKLIYEWAPVVDNEALAEATRDDPRMAGVLLAAGAGIFGNGFEAACFFVPLSTPDSKYALTTEVARRTAKADAAGDLSASQPVPTLIEMKPDPRIAQLTAERDAAQADAAAAKAADAEKAGRIERAKAALSE